MEAVSLHKQTSTKISLKYAKIPGKERKNISGEIWDAEIYIG